MGCKTLPDGTLCFDNTSPSVDCDPFQLTKTNDKDACYINNIINEHLNKGAADTFVFKLLGVHEQGQLIDLTGKGSGITKTANPSFPPGNAFTTIANEWRSFEKGQAVIDSSFLGYDFGEIKLDNDRVQYGIETFVRHNIATIRIKQGNNSVNRVTKARLERSDDGMKWFGASILVFPDDNVLNTVNAKHTAPARYWRIRPIEFNGGVTDYWSVQALELIDYDVTSIDDIQDQIFQENRDRDYATESILVKMSYDLIDVQTELTQFGIELPSQTFYLEAGFTAVVQALGRPIVIGDIIEMPSETQYSVDLTPIKKYIEVTDVGWSTNGFTPGWTPTILRIIAQPMMATQETQDIFGGLQRDEDGLGLDRYTNDNEGLAEHPIFQDDTLADHSIRAEANTMLPERGSDTADITMFSDDEILTAEQQGLNNLQSVNLRPKNLYVEDALPPNGESFTEGDVLPASPVEGAYHRLTYSTVSADIPPRLFRWSTSKNRWLFLESDKRQRYNDTKPKLQDFYTNPVSLKEIK